MHYLHVSTHHQKEVVPPSCGELPIFSPQKETALCITADRKNTGKLMMRSCSTLNMALTFYAQHFSAVKALYFDGNNQRSCLCKENFNVGDNVLTSSTAVLQLDFFPVPKVKLHVN